MSQTAISRLRREIPGYIAQAVAPQPSYGNEALVEPMMSTLDLCIDLEEVIRGHEAQAQAISERLRTLGAL